MHTVYRLNGFLCNNIETVLTLSKNINEVHLDQALFYGTNFDDDLPVFNVLTFKDFIFREDSVFSFDKVKIEQLLVLYNLLGGSSGLPEYATRNEIVSERITLFKQAARLLYEI